MKQPRFAWFLTVLAMLLSMPAYSQVMVDTERTQGLISSPVADDYKLVSLSGPGDFLAAEVVKQGGSNDLTFVSLDIDGRNVVNISFAALLNLGLTHSNPYGLVLVSSGDPKTLTIGFPTPLRYRRSLVLSIAVREAGVVQVLGNVVHGIAVTP
jgi:hypothetical protein